MRNLTLLFATVVLVLLNGFFVAAEFSMVRLRHTRVEAIRKKYGFRGKILASVHQHLDAYLSACQVGITLASLGLGWVGEPVVASLLSPFLLKFHFIPKESLEFISFAIAFSLLSFLHIVVGELVPKSLAIRQAEPVSLWTAIPIYLFYGFVYPAIWVLNSCSNLLLKKIGLSQNHHGENYHSTEEIKIILNASHLHGELSKDETEILESTLKFADLSVTDIMRSDDEMVFLEINDPIEKTLSLIMDKRYSRYPVYNKQIEQMIGMIHVKDLFSELYHHRHFDSLKPFLRPVLKVSHQLLAIDLLKKFRQGMPHFALVYGDYHNLVGFVTLDNLLHNLVGRIKDEFHRTREDWIVEPDGSIVIMGNCSIYTLERALDKDLIFNEGESDVETLAGLIMAKTENFPVEGQRVEFRDFDVIIEKISGTKILKARVFPKPDILQNE